MWELVEYNKYGYIFVVNLLKDEKENSKMLIGVSFELFVLCNGM